MKSNLNWDRYRNIALNIMDYLIRNLNELSIAFECNIIITSIIHSKSWKGRERVVKKYDTQRPHVDPRQSMGEGTEKK